MSLSSRISKGAHGSKEQKDFEASWMVSSEARTRLADLYVKEIENLYKDDEDIENFNCPNWKERQAFNLGMRKALRKVIDDLQSEV